MDQSSRILLVNDDLYFSGRLVSILRKLGFDVVIAGNSDDAITSALAIRPSLIIVNLNSVKLGGIGLIRKLKDEIGDSRILAFLSHTRIPEVRQEVLAAGADSICANSAITMRLPDLVRALLEGRSLKPEDEE